ncbi:MAG: autotransporter domain-containing protein [Desulfobacteraceae bacterium]|nr:MAG: autotransporter domain-containing protein [Desulfobacteraceae bacterium]
MFVSPLYVRFANTAAALLLLVLFWLGIAAAPVSADDVTTGGYVFLGGQTVDQPNVFVSLDPASDTIRFEPGAVLDADIPPDTLNLKDQWARWHRETGADPVRRGDYDLKTLAAITVGNTYESITIGEGSRIINRDELGDGMLAMGSHDINIGKDALLYGRWASLSFGNFEDPDDADFFTFSLTNNGNIGPHYDDDPDENPSRFGVLVYRGVEGHIVNAADGVIRGDHSGILTNYIESDSDDPDSIPDYSGDEPMDYAEGRSFSLDNYGQIKGRLYGVYEGGQLEDVRIVNHETGQIEGGIAGIYLLRGGDIVNYGDIEGEDAGIFIAAGTADITNYGTIAVTGEDADGEKNGDAIRFGGKTVGGSVTLYATVDGGIGHHGDTSEALIHLRETDNASVGNIGFGEGGIIQYGGTWTLGDVTAGAMSIEGGEMRLSKEVDVDGIDIENGASLVVSGGAVTTKDLINRGTLDFQDGEIAVNGGLYEHNDVTGIRDFTIAGLEEDQNPHLRLIKGAGTWGINSLFIGGDHGGGLTLEDDSMVSYLNRLEVNDKGRLAGAGTVGGDVFVRSGGAIAAGHPEDPISSLAISGDLVIDQDAVIEIGIAGGDNNNSKIDVSGDVAINGGALKVTDYSGFTVQEGSTYTFLTAGSALTGEFDAVHSFSQLYRVDLFYWTTGASFSLTRMADYQDFVQTENQARTMRALEACWDAGYLEDLRYTMDSLLDGVLEDTVPQSHLQSNLAVLDPEPYQASFRINADQIGQMSRHLMQGARRSRLQMVTGDAYQLAEMLGTAAPSPDLSPAAAEEAMKVRSRIHPERLGTSTWAKPIRLFYGGFHREAEVDAVINRTGHEYRSRGYYLGFERERSPQLITGASIGYTYNHARFDDNRGVLRTDSFRLGPHITLKRNNLEIDVALSGGVHQNRQERRMMYPEVPTYIPRTNIGIDLSDLYAGPSTAVSRFNIYDGSAYTDARYNLVIREVWKIVPSASLQYIYQHREGIREQRGGDINLKIDSDSQETLYGVLGINLGREISGSTFVLVPELFARYRHDMMQGDVDIDARFANAPASPDREIRVTGAGTDKSTSVVGAGITALFGDYNMAYFGYEAEITDSGSLDTFFAGVKWNF